MNKNRAARDLAILIGLTLALTVPYINQAFHIDDGLWIDIAGIISKNPLHPYARGEYNYLGIRYSGTLYSGTHPLLIPYFMAFLLYLGQGPSELIFHGAFLIFPIIAAVSFYAISLKFCRNPFGAALLFISSPAFVVMAHTVMLDIPLVSFWLASVAAFLYGAERRSVALLIVSAAASAMAVFTAYQGLSLAPLLIALALIRGWKYRRAMVAAATPLILFLAWALPSLLSRGSFPLSAAYSHVRFLGEANLISASNVAHRMISSLANFGGVMVSTPLLIYLALFRAKLKIPYYGALFLSFIAYLVFARNYGASQRILLLAFLSAAGVFFYSISVSALRPNAPGKGGEKYLRAIFKRGGGDDLFLFLWVSGVFFYADFFMPWGAARYLLPALAPGVIYICRLAEKSIPAKIFPPIISGAVILNLGLSLALSQIDYSTASIYRGLPGKVAHLAGGAEVWFVGDWGFRHYLEGRGYNYLLSDDDSPADGGIIAVSHLAVPHLLNKKVLLRMAPYASIDYQYRLPLRLISEDARAGFYSHGWGYLPFSLSRAPLDKIELFKIIDLKEFDLSKAKISTPNPSFVGLKSFEAGGDRRIVIFAHPPSDITYQIDLPDRPRLSFGIATDPNNWDIGLGDGVTFEIWVSAGGRSYLAYKKYIDAKANPSQRRWHDEEIDLSQYAGAQATITLRSSPGPAGDPRFDGAGWSNLKISNAPPR